MSCPMYPRRSAVSAYLRSKPSKRTCESDAKLRIHDLGTCRCHGMEKKCLRSYESAYSSNSEDIQDDRAPTCANDMLFLEWNRVVVFAMKFSSTSV
jgi:hypothetical protein